MVNPNQLYQDALRVLKQTSRTFYIPIRLLKPNLEKAVTSAYLSMRAIDEIEDHVQLSHDTKVLLLNRIGRLLESSFDHSAYQQLIKPYIRDLPEVTIRLGDWLSICPDGIVERVKSATQTMTKGMAKWVAKDWEIRTKDDLDDYTYYVAGLVGVMLSDIWYWHDQTEADVELAVGFGRGLQAVNILRNQLEDQARGICFFPDDWKQTDMFEYANHNLMIAKTYIENITNPNILVFCKIPFRLANHTLKALKKGQEKLSRKEVKGLVEEVINES
ncbi:squalene/phytoene synthase family protein [Amphibacillus sediminis]|uniref:squalene/phytoene synthase family protein n=1 Tax=Amphibacillus sediminis TaxID=360185 RepID=UPI000832A69A|nr:phytoene/squalene synthase family protein [Amphibacillus sediminis]